VTKKSAAPQTAPTKGHPDNAKQNELLNAGVIKRLGAMVYDCFLLFGVLFVATLLVSLISSDLSLASTPGDGEVVTDIDQTISSNLMSIYLGSLIILFYGWFWRRSGQTLGMHVWYIKVVSKDGGKPSWGQCLLRGLVGFVSIATFGLGYWWIWLDKQQLSWHDRASSTKVLQLPKPPKKKK
jgi:uncharacterized RDD family membrane protein YckC